MSLANANVANIYLSPRYFTNTPSVYLSTITVFNPDPRRNYTVGLNILHNDGLTDGQEVLKYGINPLNPDTAGDMLVDGEQANFDKVSWK